MYAKEELSNTQTKDATQILTPDKKVVLQQSAYYEEIGMLTNDAWGWLRKVKNSPRVSEAQYAIMGHVTYLTDTLQQRLDDLTKVTTKYITPNGYGVHKVCDFGDFYPAHNREHDADAIQTEQLITTMYKMNLNWMMAQIDNPRMTRAARMLCEANNETIIGYFGGLSYDFDIEIMCGTDAGYDADDNIIVHDGTDAMDTGSWVYERNIFGLLQWRFRSDDDNSIRYFWQENEAGINTLYANPSKQKARQFGFSNYRGPVL